MSPVTGYGPYQATFHGGVIDGQVREVISLAPDRAVSHSSSQKLPVAMQGRGRALPGAYDVYAFDGVEAGHGRSCSYTYVRTVLA